MASGERELFSPGGTLPSSSSSTSVAPKIDPNLLAGLAEIDDNVRFFMELEFLQCLAQPYYLKYLADGRYLQDEAFVNYLSYLRYWKQPQYAKYLIYPQSLHFLDLLQDPLFRTYCAAAPNIEFMARQVANHWKFARNNRLEAAVSLLPQAVETPNEAMNVS